MAMILLALTKCVFVCLPPLFETTSLLKSFVHPDNRAKLCLGVGGDE